MKFLDWQYVSYCGEALVVFHAPLFVVGLALGALVATCALYWSK